MKKVVSILVFLFCTKSIAQDKIVNDIIRANNKDYPMALVDCGSSSYSKAAILFTCDIESFEKYKNDFFKRVTGRKAEYTQFYILGYEKNISKEDLKNLLSQYLRKIDTERMKNNLSTLQIKFTIDKLNKPLPKITYYPEIKKDIQNIDNLYLNLKFNEMCTLSGLR